jgi:hypothetical protein
LGKPEQSQKEEEADNKNEYDEGRRNFLKLAMGTSAILAFAGVGTVLKSIANPALPGATSTSFPRVKVGNLDSLKVNEPVIFNYPLDNEPNVLVKL